MPPGPVRRCVTVCFSDLSTVVRFVVRVVTVRPSAVFVLVSLTVDWVVEEDVAPAVPFLPLGPATRVAGPPAELAGGRDASVTPEGGAAPEIPVPDGLGAAPPLKANQAPTRAARSSATTATPERAEPPSAPASPPLVTASP